MTRDDELTTKQARVQATRLMHEQPHRAWTASALATCVAMSRSAFSARFRLVIGEPPMRYLTRYRLARAADRLRTSGSGHRETLLVTLAPDACQHAALVRTVEAFNDACNWIAGVAYEHGCANKTELQKLVYYDARERFGLAAQMAIRAISKVVEAYKRDTTIKPTFRRHGAMTYDERVLAFKGLDYVSILTLDGRVLVPIRIKEYFEARRDRIKGQSDLLYRNGTFYVGVTLDAPEPTPDEGDDFLGVDLENAL